MNDKETIGATPGVPTPLGLAVGADLDEVRAEAQIAAALFGRAKRPVKIGRFVVLSELGRGGMGVVYSAFDEQLDRKLAIKLLLLAEETTAPDRERLLREAQAMAKLSHTNVVQVYEVGEHDGKPFIAMEFVAGSDLRVWLAKGPHDWREVRRVLTAAGCGLAAAHAAGLVHRDFKPENALVDPEGCVKITDFGITRITAAPPSVGQDTIDEDLADGDSLTRTGVLMGTPAYMAPEQWRGEPPRHAADQFALCVVLFEALMGERPYQGDSVSTLSRAVTTGTMVQVAKPPGVPTHLLAVARRGLSPHPADRFTSMNALLEALSQDPSRTRRRWAMGGVAVAALGATIALTPAQSTPTSEPCAGGTAAMAVLWDDAIRARVDRAFARTAQPNATTAAEKSSALLDVYTDRWADAHKAVCLEAQRGERSADLLDASMACLAQRRAGLAALIDRFVDADTTTTDNAVAGVLGLHDLNRCRDALALSTWLRQPEDVAERATVAALRDRIAAVDAVTRFGELGPGLAEAEAIASDARALAYIPVRSEALRLLGDLQERTGDIKHAKQNLRRALVEAQAGRHLDMTVRAAGELAYVLGYRERGPDAGFLLLDLAEGAVRGMGGGDRPLAKLTGIRAAILFRAGSYAPAAAQFERALALRLDALGRDAPDDLVTLSARANLGAAYLHLGRLGQAHEVLADVLTRAEAEGWQTHPNMAGVLGSLGNVALTQGDTEPAHVFFKRSVDLYRATVGPEAPDLAIALLRLSITHTAHERFERAIDCLGQSRAIFERAYGKEHVNIATTIANTAAVLSQAGRHQEAAVLTLEALGMRQRLLEPNHLDLAYTNTNYAVTLADLGRSAEAIPFLERAIAILGTNKTPDPITVVAEIGLGNALHEAGRPREALPHYERAVKAAYALVEHDTEIRARAEFQLGRALWDVPQQREQARRMFALATANYRKSSQPDGADRVADWLAKRH